MPTCWTVECELLRPEQSVGQHRVPHCTGQAPDRCTNTYWHGLSTHTHTHTHTHANKKSLVCSLFFSRFLPFFFCSPRNTDFVPFKVFVVVVVVVVAFQPYIHSYCSLCVCLPVCTYVFYFCLFYSFTFILSLSLSSPPPPPPPPPPLPLSYTHSVTPSPPPFFPPLSSPSNNFFLVLFLLLSHSSLTSLTLIHFISLPASPFFNFSSFVSPDEFKSTLSLEPKSKWFVMNTLQTV